MDKQELTKFVEWLPNSIQEFKNKTPEEVVTILNKMSQTEEGLNTISSLIDQFKQSSQMFKLGGVISFLKKGGNYDRKKARANKTKLGLRNNENRAEIAGDNNILAKIAKAAAVEGFDTANFNFDSNQKFDRDKYRASKKWAKENTDLDRRQRKAFALLEGIDQSIKKPEISAGRFKEFLPKTELPKPKRYTKGIVVVGDPSVQTTEVRDFNDIKRDLRAQAFGPIPGTTPIKMASITVNSNLLPDTNVKDVRTIIEDMGFGKVRVPKFENSGEIENPTKNSLSKKVTTMLQNSKANFAKRSLDNNRKTISDWQDSNKQVSFKLDYIPDKDGLVTLYPRVSEGYDGTLTDFTHPKFDTLTASKNPGYDIAIMNRDTMRMTEEEAKEIIKKLQGITR